MFIMPPIEPKRPVGHALPLADRRRLATILTESTSMTEAVSRWGGSRDAFVKLCNREGFGGLVEDLRWPLKKAMADAENRKQLVAMIEAGWTVKQLAEHYKVTRVSIYNFIIRHGLQPLYRKQRRRRRDASLMLRPPKAISAQMQERLRVGALLAARGHTVSCRPRWKNGTLVDFTLMADGEEVKIAHLTEITVAGTQYYRLVPSAAYAWYVVLTDQGWAVVYRPPHDGRVKYIPPSNPYRALNAQQRALYVLNQDEWAAVQSPWRWKR